MNNKFSITVSVVCVIIFILAALLTAYVEYNSNKNVPAPINSKLGE